MMNALDLMLEIMDARSNYENLSEVAFALKCATENFAEVAPPQYAHLAEALCKTCERFYLSVEPGSLAPADGQQFRRFEKIYFCLNEISLELGNENWLALVAWRKLQAVYKPVKMILVRSE